MPEQSTVRVGESFTVTVRVQSGTNLIDGAQASIDFDPAYLQVENIIGDGILPLQLLNQHDNAACTLDYAAGALSNFPSGTVSLVHIRFRLIAQTASTELIFHTQSPR